MTFDYTPGTLCASERLIRELYLDVRMKVNLWSRITKQTPQARMGYVGQHLVSVVTGYPGSKSGGRGHDLVVGENRTGEIKTCCRVDQLGSCRKCKGMVSAIETRCSACGSHNIERRGDSKWLIGIHSKEGFAEILDPEMYYFVLFEPDAAGEEGNIVASIWQTDPKFLGFGLCLIDYYTTIRARSPSKAPFNLYPYSLKFYMMNPTLIYRSVIGYDDSIHTLVFPALGNTKIDPVAPLDFFSKGKTLSADAVKRILVRLDPAEAAKNRERPNALRAIEKHRHEQKLDNRELCRILAEEIYLPRIIPHKESLPSAFREQYSQLA